MHDSRNYYKILAVSPGATLEEIKQAYRRLVRQYHPDLHPDNSDATERFKVICEAYQVLSDEVKRRQYDEEVQPQSNPPKRESMTAQDFYVRAVSKALAKKYQGVVKDCNQAISINPQFVDAYVERGAAYYKLGNARVTLQDCNQALRINSQFAPAYYYQGRARYRLGYSQAAIDAYTQAIAYDSTHAKAYYQRGLAHKDLKEFESAIADFHQAAQLLREQGDKTGYRLVQETLKTLKQSQGKWGGLKKRNPLHYLKELLGDILATLKSFLLNPMGGLLPSFARLDAQRAMVVGFLLAAIFDACFVWGIYTGWRDVVSVSLIPLIGVGMMPFIILVLMSAIARLIRRHPGSLAGDSFLAGATLMPLTILAIANGISSNLPSQLMVMITVFTSCYTILTLYSGCTQIANLSEKTAALLVPVMVLVSGWISYWAFMAMLGMASF
ncbi:DnaJ domain-containing protein [Coleofasciculus chthonoplastes]|uniref:DnaJ domain-containing protein n=1 Tax=Coleofasciculus chthonoplastes TaxID=64178 RepID=UPI0032F4FD65